MSLRQVRNSGRQRADEVLHAFGRFPGDRRCSLKKRLERHPNDVRRPAPQAAGCSPERATQRCWQTDGDLILHEKSSNRCTAIVVRRTAAGKVPGRHAARPPLGTRPSTCAHQCAQIRSGGHQAAANANQATIEKPAPVRIANPALHVPGDLMTSPGRNDPCPCGSGRKYKHCCLRAIDADDAARTRLRTAEGVLVPALFSYAVEELGNEFVAEA